MKKTFARLLALLMVLCMLPGFGYAEPVEEPASEEAAVLAEPAIEATEPAAPEEEVIEEEEVATIAACSHPNVDTWPSYKDPVYTDPTPKGHTVTGYLATTNYCTDCFESWFTDVASEKSSSLDSHSYDDGVCWNCGYANTCEHKNMRTYKAMYEGEVIDKNDRGHTLYGFIGFEGYCEDCGTYFDLGHSDYKEEMFEEHYYEDGVCLGCGYKSGCKHPNADSWDDYVDATYSDPTADGHTVTGYACTRYYCPDCQQNWDTDIDSVKTSVRQQHSFENGECWACGYVNQCKHTNKEKTSNIYDGEYKDITAKTHTIYGYVSYEEYCNDCGEWFFLGKSDKKEEQTYNHYFENGKCYECGYVNKCKHKNTQKESYLDWENVKYSQLSATQHVAEGYAIYLTYCKDCGTVLSEEKGKNLVRRVEWHDFEEGICLYCDYVNQCSHPNGKSTYYVYEDPSYEKYDSKQHEVTAYVCTVTYCEICGAEWRFQDPDVKTTERQDHNFMDGKCLDCGYKSSCKHKNSEKKTSYYGVYSDPNASGHMFDGTKDVYKQCEDCGNTSGDVLSYVKERQPHTFDNGFCLYCGFEGSYTADPTKPAKITKQPKAQKAIRGEEVTYTVEADNAASYQWQLSTNGKQWADIGGATEASYTYAATADTAKHQFRCVIIGGNGKKVTSKAVKTTLTYPDAEIIAAPADATANYGEKASFTVEASDAKSYQWQYSTNGKKWSAQSKATKPTLEVTLKEKNVNYQYRCVIVGLNGKKVTTDAVRVNLTNPDVVITQQPEAMKGYFNDEFTLKVSAENAASYQWQQSKDGKKWSAIEGATADSYTFTATTKHKGYQFRCAITGLNNGKVNSKAAKLSLSGRPAEITQQPDFATANYGETATFTVAAKDAASYQWQQSTNGKKWTSIKKATGESYSVTVSEKTLTYKYRCMITGMNGVKGYTNEVCIVLKDPDVEIISETTGYSGYYGDSIRLTVEANNAASYQWQSSTDGKKWKDVEGATERIYDYTAEKALQFRCVITGINNGKATSKVAKGKLSYRPAAITQQPENAAANAGEKATFTLEASDAKSYQWYYSKDGVKWVKQSKATKPSLTVNVKATNLNYQYKCQIVGKAGNKIESNIVCVIPVL